MITEDNSWEGLGKVIIFESPYRNMTALRIKLTQRPLFLEEYSRNILFSATSTSIVWNGLTTVKSFHRQSYQTFHNYHLEAKQIIFNQ